MSYWLDKIDKIIEQQQEEESPLTIESIPDITLKEFSKRDIAVEIYSGVLNCNVWLCSNSGMLKKIRRGSPNENCYTIEEMKHLISISPNPKSLKEINNAKSIFPDSTIKGLSDMTDIKIPEEDT